MVSNTHVLRPPLAMRKIPKREEKSTMIHAMGCRPRKKEKQGPWVKGEGAYM